uniref:Uncharacterized protein n=1 Tax=Mycoplasma suis TaxID=57372 RepID=Q8KM85_9MOLU|nr:hypothetical protein [Mycoplasma suis]
MDQEAGSERQGLRRGSPRSGVRQIWNLDAERLGKNQYVGTVLRANWCFIF